MDRSEIAAQQARLAEHRQQQNHTKQPERPTSAAKEIDPQGQVGKDQAPLKPEFQKSHDHAIAHGEKKGPQVSPQLREQQEHQPKPGGMDGPKPPQSTGYSSDSRAHYERATKLNDALKARQEQSNDGKIKDGKDHDRTSRGG